MSIYFSSYIGLRLFCRYVCENPSTTQIVDDKHKYLPYVETKQHNVITEILLHQFIGPSILKEFLNAFLQMCLGQNTLLHTLTMTQPLAYTDTK